MESSFRKYEIFSGRPIDRVAGVGVRVASDGSLRADKVALFSGEDRVQFSVCEDTDEFTFEIISSDVECFEFEDIEQMSWIHGGEFGWIWSCRNLMGYLDMVAISTTGGIEPQIALVAIASSIQFKRMVAI